MAAVAVAAADVGSAVADDAVETAIAVVGFDVVGSEGDLGSIPDLLGAWHHRLSSYTVLHILRNILDKTPP